LKQMNLIEFGKLRGNYHADPENLFKLGGVYGCCSENAPDNCQRIFTNTVANTRKLASVTITHPDGSSITALTTMPITQANGKVIAAAYGQIAVTDAAKVEEWLTKVLELYEYDIYLRVSYAGGALTITHRGRAVLSAITFDNGSTMSEPTPCCEIVPIRVWKYVGVDQIGNFVFNGGTPAALANNPYEYTGTSTDLVTAATLKADVIDTLDGLVADDGYSYIDVEVSVNNAEGGYTIKIYTLEDEPVLVGSDGQFAFCEMTERFLCD
jgi:hypothetical protein